MVKKQTSIQNKMGGTLKKKVSTTAVLTADEIK